MKAEQIRITDMTDLTQGDGRYFEQEILDYMKYGLLDADWDELDEAGASELLEAWKEGNSVNRVSELYAAHSREAVKVEKALEIINSSLLAQRERWEVSAFPAGDSASSSRSPPPNAFITVMPTPIR